MKKVQTVVDVSRYAAPATRARKGSTADADIHVKDIEVKPVTQFLWWQTNALEAYQKILMVPSLGPAIQ